MARLEAINDFVAVIDFLPEADRKSHQISQRLIAFLAKHGIEQQWRMCNTRKEFLEALLGMAAKSMKGRKFWIQLVGHGDESKNSLYMPDDKLASWKQIAGFLGRFHRSTISTVVLNLTCCYGLHGIKMADHLDPNHSFYGILGPAMPISFRQGYKINTKIYRKMIAEIPINRIIREVNQEFGRELLFGITAHGYRELKADAQGQVKSPN